MPGNALIALSYLLVSTRVEAGAILYQAQSNEVSCSPELSFVISGAVTVYFEGRQARSTRTIEMLATMDQGMLRVCNDMPGRLFVCL